MTIQSAPAIATLRPSPAAEELEHVGRLAAPLIGANLGQVLLGAVDTAVLGRLGAAELGAGGLGCSLFFTVAVLGTGVVYGFEPLIAQALGANESARAKTMLRHAMGLGVLTALPLSALALIVGLSLERVGVTPSAAALARSYLFVRVLGLVPYLVFTATRTYLQAEQRAYPVLMGAMIANVVNLPACWILALGDVGLSRLGLPAMGLPAHGVVGAAWASVLADMVQTAVLLTGIRRTLRLPCLSSSRVTKKALRLGAPIGAAMLAEYGVFALVDLQMGNLDGISLAAHQVAITFAAATFAVSLAIGAAAAVRVGRAVGAAEGDRSRAAGLAATVLGGTLMVVASMALWLFPRQLAAIITDRPEVLQAAVPLLRIAALFQISDGLQAIAAGALRGTGDTRFALLANLLGHYGIGLPSGAVLAFVLGWGAPGLWCGLSFGLTVVAIGLVIRFLSLTRARLVRI